MCELQAQLRQAAEKADTHRLLLLPPRVLPKVRADSPGRKNVDGQRLLLHFVRCVATDPAQAVHGGAGSRVADLNLFLLIFICV